jgi:PII-like signaling protein
VTLTGPAKRLTIYVGEQDTYKHHSVATEIVHRAHSAGLAGATVFRGIEGYGATNHIHTTRILSLSDDLPISIVIIDRAEAIEAFADEIAELVGGGLVLIEDVMVLGYRPHERDGGSGSSPGSDGTTGPAGTER